MAKKILFVPWPRSLGDSRSEYTTFSSDIQMTSTGRVKLGHPGWDQTGAGLEYKMKNRPWIEHERGKGHEAYEVWYAQKLNVIVYSASDPEDDIYIRGHCMPGYAYIFSKYGIGNEAPLDASAVGDRLIESGLQTSFPGSIKCYNCHSAEGDNLSFAQILAEYLYGCGYRACRYFGYRGALDSFPGSDPSFQDTHKHSTAGGRASENRIEIFPS